MKNTGINKMILSRYVFESCRLSDQDSLILLFDLNNVEKVKLIFENLIYLSYQRGGCGLNLYPIDNPQLLQDALANIYKEVPPIHDFKVYQIEDNEHNPYIQVIATVVRFQIEETFLEIPFK